MLSKLRVGIAGFGVIGPRRRAVIDIHPNMKTVAVCDKSFGEDGIFDDGVKFYSDYHKLLNEDLDILFVCVTHDVAPEVTIAGLARGLHVFCEKPPGRSITDVQKVIDEEKKHLHLKLKYGFNHRYHDSVRDALKIIASKELGTIINIRGVYGKSLIGPRNAWRSQRAIAGGGILLDQGIHMLDLMLCFAGSFTHIKSFVSNNFWEHDVEDNAYVLMKSKSGVIAMLHSTATQWRHRFNLEISLTKGSIALSGILTGTKSYGQETLCVTVRGENDSGNPKETLTNYIEDNSWRDEVFEFADAVLNKTDIKIGTSFDALAAMDLVYKIYNADDEWKNKHDLNLF